MEINIEVIESLLREDVKRLETDITKIEKKMNKLLLNFNPRDIQKLDKYAADINNLNHTIFHLYILIGNLRDRVEEQS